MEALQIEIEENGYGIYDSTEQAFVIEGIREFETACELHEMLLGEREEADEGEKENTRLTH